MGLDREAVAKCIATVVNIQRSTFHLPYRNYLAPWSTRRVPQGCAPQPCRSNPLLNSARSAHRFCLAGACGRSTPTSAGLWPQPARRTPSRGFPRFVKRAGATLRRERARAVGGTGTKPIRQDRHLRRVVERPSLGCVCAVDFVCEGETPAGSGAVGPPFAMIRRSRLRPRLQG